jgi:hypothetical protein
MSTTNFDINHLDNFTLVDLIQLGFILLNEKRSDDLKLLSEHLFLKYPKCFWSYCFKAMSETGLDLTKPIGNLSYQLNDDDIQDDLKSRIYHYARIKYSKCPKDKYEAISKFYPDIYEGGVYKAKTNYENKLEVILDLKSKYDLISDKYVSEMELHSISEKEVAIVHNFKLWGKYLEFALSSLNKYNEKA